MIIELIVDEDLPSQNGRFHWRQWSRIRKRQREAVAFAVRKQFPRLAPVKIHAMVQALLPAKITLAHVSAGRRQDYDNTVGCLKAVRDGIASCFFGLDDADPRLQWVYEHRFEREQRGCGSYGHVVVELLGDGPIELSQNEEIGLSRNATPTMPTAARQRPAKRQAVADKGSNAPGPIDASSGHVDGLPGHQRPHAHHEARRSDPEASVSVGNPNANHGPVQ